MHEFVPRGSALPIEMANGKMQLVEVVTRAGGDVASLKEGLHVDELNESIRSAIRLIVGASAEICHMALATCPSSLASRSASRREHS
jgi:hypothetical protein